MDGGDDTEGSLAPLLARIDERLPKEQAAMVAGLAQAAYRRALTPDAGDLDADTTVDQLVGGLAFIDSREPGTLALHVDDAVPGSPGSGTAVEVNVEDAPFLVSTLSEELSRLGLTVGQLLHPVVGVERDRDGRVTAIQPARGAAHRESWIRAILAESLDADAREHVATCLRRVLSDARAATRDFPAMREAVEEAAFQARASAGARYEPEEVDEACALLRWLLDDHFIWLGYREYVLIPPSDDGERTVAVRHGTGLGILADEDTSSYANPVPLSELRDDLRARIEGGGLIRMARTNRVSTVHRQERMIDVGMKQVGGDGEIVGERRFLGLFAQRAFAEPASTIPELRRKLRHVLEREDIVEHSHDERAVRELFEALPKHELFETDLDELHRELMALLDAQRRQHVRLLVRSDPSRRSVSALVAVPAWRFDGALRRALQRLLVEWFAATGADYHLSIAQRDQALLHFLLHVEQPPPDGPVSDVAELERAVVALTRRWDDELVDALVSAHGEAKGRRLAGRYEGRFPPGYTAACSVEEAVADIAVLESLEDVSMAVRSGRDDGELRFKLAKTGGGVELSRLIPILESLGLTVVEEIPHELELEGGPVTLHDLGVRPPAGLTVDVGADGSRLTAAARAIWDGRVEMDAFNRLVLHARLGWWDAAVLRAYRRYRRLVGAAYTPAYEAEALIAHPEVARGLIELFAARFDPELPGPHSPREAPAGPESGAVEQARTRVHEACDVVERLDQDRILRGYLWLIEATLRTNAYQPDRACLSFKLDSAHVPGMPKPVPYAEIYTYSPGMEGVHLRGGPVSRGGVRVSDRLEDFRTEVLGLLQAQIIKNAVIVPTGAKGGFVVRDRAVANAVRSAYETFIRGMLDVTDNIVGGQVVPPQRVRRFDGNDPYLVVAPDRGTAAFSDVANAIADDYDFWLSDAFASGGSRGYDHKRMGITARGAWLAVRRHFWELDVDVQREPITITGIGDMSGDVFGNGLLRSDAVKLVAAFDHRHIFLDPDPDPKRSYAERARLFRLPESTWDHYDRTVLSPGGGVWPRTLKAIPLSDEIRTLLGIQEGRMSPPELIRAILRAPVDLLFAGGVGTFVRAEDERDIDVGDLTNDAIRVHAGELGARVVGEGANLAMTQRARVRYARRGGKCNTDAIDNAAGVDTSDREVNLKILLRQAMDAGELDPEARDSTLAAMTDEVATLALDSVARQTWALSAEVARSPALMDAYEALMVHLSSAGQPAATPEARAGVGRLDREVEALPTTGEMSRRKEAGAGLTRPELAVLLSYAKTDLATRFLRSDLPDRELVNDALTGAFPPTAVARFGRLLPDHRLRRELAATVVAGDLVDRMGITYASQTTHELGVAADEVATAYWLARTVTDADRRWRMVRELDGTVNPSVQLDLKAEVDALVDACTRTYLRRGPPHSLAAGPEGEEDRIVPRDREAFQQLERAVNDLGSEARRAAREARASRYADLGVPYDTARQLVGVAELTLLPDVAAVAEQTPRGVSDVAEAFLRLSEETPLDRLTERLGGLRTEGVWEQWQLHGLDDELRELRRVVAARALAERPAASGEEAVQAFVEGHRRALDRVDVLMSQAGRDGWSVDALGVVVRTLREALAAPTVG